MSADLPRRLPEPRRGRATLRRRLAWRRRSARRTPLASIRARRGGRKRWPRRVIIGAAALVALLVVAVVGGVVYSVFRLDQIHRIHVAGLASVKPNAPFDVLLVGTDADAYTDPVYGATPNNKPQLAALVVARVDPTTRQAHFFSIPLETEVDVPANTSGVNGPHPIGATFAGGPSLLVQTVEQSLHIPVNSYAAVNFAGLASIVGALGGVHLDFRYPLRDSYTGLAVSSPGCQLLDGSETQALVRSDHLYYFSGGAWRAEKSPVFGTLQRHDASLRALLSGAKSTVTNPIALDHLLSSVVANLTVNDSLSTTKVLYLAQLFRGFAPEQLVATTLPTVPYTTPAGAAVLATSSAADRRAISEFLAFGSPSGTVRVTTVTTVPGAPKGGTNVITDAPTYPWNPVPC